MRSINRYTVCEMTDIQKSLCGEREKERERIEVIYK
jgi:hypothetical protein